MTYEIRDWGDRGWDCLLPWVGHDGDQVRLEYHIERERQLDSCFCLPRISVYVHLSGLDDYGLAFTDGDWPRSLGLDDPQTIAHWADEMCRALSTFAGSGVRPWPRGEKP